MRYEVESLEPMILLSAGVTQLEAVHHNGQTFLTWQEDTTIVGEEYHVYRYSEAITADNIGDAELLTLKWGPLDDDTSVHQLAGPGAPSHFVIEDLGSELSDDTGLFVYTTQDGESGNAFYAVTLVVNGVEQALDVSGDALATSVQETAGETAPILVNSVNGGKGRVYTQFMDYKTWNPTFQGYAYNYAVALPADYDPSKDYALKVNLHAYTGSYQFLPQTEYGWQTIELFVDDPGADRGTIHTWWYGFAADHNYRTDGPIPTSGVIENFTEQRVLKAIDEVVANSDFSVDTTRIHAQGHSMGGSGALSLGIRYGDLFAGIYSSEGMTNYAASPGFQNEFVQLWGSQQDNLLIVNNGPHASAIAQYGAGQPEQTGVWNWLNHGEQLLRRRGENIAFLMFGHGKDDTVIDWETQGRPFLAAVEAAGVAFTAEDRDNWSHNWMGFSFAPHNLFSAGYGDLGEWSFKDTSSFLAIANATGSGPVPPTSTGTDFYNLNIEWATSWNAFHDDIVDSTDYYEISVRSTTVNQTASVTPRDFQQFSASAGQTVYWKSVDNNSDQVLQQGQVVVDSDGLITLNSFSVRTGLGSRLILSKSPIDSTSLPRISISDTVAFEGNSGSKFLQLTASLNAPSTQTVSAAFATIAGSATAGEDYTARSGVITFAPGSTSATIDLEVLGDTLTEGDEAFTVRLSDVQNGVISDGEAIVQILNDDTTGGTGTGGTGAGGGTTTGDLSRVVATSDTVLTRSENLNANLGAFEQLSLYTTSSNSRTMLLQFDVDQLSIAPAERAF
ncbi:MAG: hypothetical protein KDA81_07690, partial [Planctomycetaceae bacterium]|nr:hypothetical protein [Planctomycetaceae bacterium]